MVHVKSLETSKEIWDQIKTWFQTTNQWKLTREILYINNQWARNCSVYFDQFNYVLGELIIVKN
jgi:hypothetical protein